MSVAYGALELKAGYQKGLAKAVFFAAGLHAAIIGGVLLYDYIRSLSAEDRGVMVISDVKPLPPPSLQNKPLILKVEPPKVSRRPWGFPKPFRTKRWWSR